MSALTLTITTAGMDAALNAVESGFQLKAKYIAFGDESQTLAMSSDRPNLTTTNSLANQRGIANISSSKRIGEAQWQLSINIKDATNDEFELKEFGLLDENQMLIAIISSQQALLSVTDALDSVLLSVNLLLDAFPADSVEIISANQPLELSYLSEFLTMANVQIQEMQAQSKLQIALFDKGVIDNGFI